MLLVLAVAAASLVLSSGFLPDETDFWQHLLVGRVLWETGSIPHTQIWTWPTFGTPDVLPSWGFRALLWPFWKIGGAWGLYLWRWLTTLLAFGFLWATGRRMGARGIAAVVVITLGGLVYRSRAQVRPETLVAILLALELWILECRRRGFGDRSPWLIVIAWAWANIHISWYLGFVVLACYGVHDWRSRVPRRGRLLLVLAGMAVVSFLNPFGWRALWQPFDFALHGRGEVIFRDIVELQPVDWRTSWRSGLPLLVAGWPALIVWRGRHGRIDWTEGLLCLFFTTAGVMVRRFIGFYAVVATPFLMRDVDEWITARSWPGWSRNPWARAALACVTCIGIGLPEWTRPDLPLRVGVREDRYPIQAAEFVIEHEVRGRVFNPFYFGGYMLYRFWPDRGRLPFMDIHQAGTPELRFLYMRVFYRPIGWAELDRRYRFDWALVDRVQRGADRLLDWIDADSSFALVFLDDVAAVYVRRDGPMRDLAARLAYRTLPASPTGRAAVLQASLADSALRRRVIDELEREAAGSPWHTTASRILSSLSRSR